MVAASNSQAACTRRCVRDELVPFLHRVKEISTEKNNTAMRGIVIGWMPELVHADILRTAQSAATAGLLEERRKEVHGIVFDTGNINRNW